MHASSVIALVVSFSVREELKLKIAGPKEVRFNQPTQFMCNANHDDVEVKLLLNTHVMTESMGKAEFLLHMECVVAEVHWQYGRFVRLKIDPVEAAQC